METIICVQIVLVNHLEIEYLTFTSFLKKGKRIFTVQPNAWTFWKQPGIMIKIYNKISNVSSIPNKCNHWWNSKSHFTATTVAWHFQYEVHFIRPQRLNWRSCRQLISDNYQDCRTRPNVSSSVIHWNFLFW